MPWIIILNLVSLSFVRLRRTSSHFISSVWHPPFCCLDSTLYDAPSFPSTVDRSVNILGARLYGKTREKGRLSNMRSREGVAGVFLVGYASLPLTLLPKIQLRLDLQGDLKVKLAWCRPTFATCLAKCAGLHVLQHDWVTYGLNDQAVLNDVNSSYPNRATSSLLAHTPSSHRNAHS